MSPMHLTVVVVLCAAALVCVAVEIVTSLVLLRKRSESVGRLLLIGLAAAVCAHLSVYGLTGDAWAATLCVLPFAAVAVLSLPRSWEPPPRRARLIRPPRGELPAPPELPAVLDSERLRWIGCPGEPAIRSVTETEPLAGTEQEPSAALSESERAAWESLRRSLGES